MTSCWRTNKPDTKEQNESTALSNGRILLEKQIAFCNGKSNPLRIFSANELEKATDNYNPNKIITRDSGYNLYRGLLQEERPVSIKKFKENFEQYEYCFNDILFASKMSVHKNFLKLLGCCLETQVPVLVFESVEYGTLADRIYGPEITLYQPLLWVNRLKIAMEIANAVAYLHSAFEKPIVFRNIKPLNIFLDECSIAKLSDFSIAVSIPEGESHVNDPVAGAWGLIAPEYAATERFNERQDVYNFGVFLLILLTGKMAIDHSRTDPGLVDHVKEHIEGNKFDEILDSRIVGKDDQLQGFMEVSLKCISEAEENRPVMIEVAKELRKIYKSAISI
ncbi:non-functional pseudokinase ZED1-like [Euphorbia lathyris]|uniref:non-functional pseudokinase ZED1-like n=1 Tax=Euphorbia lathyris TaxID=212925 RepID=UPI003313BD3A